MLATLNSNMITSRRLLNCLGVFFLFYTCVQGGTLVANFGESDFSSPEHSGFLEFIITINGNQEHGDIVFRVDAVTVDMYRERIMTLPSLCQAHFSAALNQVSNIDPGEVTDLDMTVVNCTRNISDNRNQIKCGFSIRNETIFEGDELFVFLLSVADAAGNNIMLDSKCAIGYVRTADNGQPDLRLSSSMPRPVTITEGQGNFSFKIEKNFLTEVPIEIMFLISRASSRGGGVDYWLNNGDRRAVTILANETHITLPVEIIDDQIPENDEQFEIIVSAAFVYASGSRREIPIIPSKEQVRILDNDVMTIGFELAEMSISVEEGDQRILCTTFLSPSVFDVNRDFHVKFQVINGSATEPQHFRSDIEFMSDFERTLGIFDEVCITLTTNDNSILELPKTFSVVAVDEDLEMLSDPLERAARERLNIVDPCCITVTILDNDGTPLKPNITKIRLISESKDNQLVFEWDIDEEDGLRKVDCFYGNIKTSGRQASDQSNVETRVTSMEFDYCPSGKSTTYTLHDVDSNKQYTIVVCTRNSLGDMCSEPYVYNPHKSSVVGPGLVTGIVVAVVLLVGCCCLMLFLCLFLCWHGKGREKRYFPQKREKQLNKEFGLRNLPHNSENSSSLSDEEEDEYKLPL